MEFLVDLNKVEDVKEFVKFASLYDTVITVSNQNRNFVVDGSSLMGLFSLDLSKPVVVHIGVAEIGNSFKKDISKFVVKEALEEK